jgi:hypothetical protein
VAIGALLPAVFLSPSAFAQATGATVRGLVTLNEAPAASAQVTATNVETGFTRTVESNVNGRYTLAGLPPGTYQVSVDAGGNVSIETITVRVGQTASLDLAVADSGDEAQLDTVEVVGTVLHETKTSEISTYITPKQIEALPQSSRNFLAFADTVPGMQFEERANGTSQLKSGAQSANGINVFIDGVGQKNYVLKGGISGQDQSRGNPFPQLGIAEYKVITSNYKAEFDQISSAAVVAVTRSGNNEFEGNVFYDYTDQGWRASTAIEARDGRKTKSETEQYGFSIGGPIIKDMLHFFLTYERKNITDPREVRINEGYTVDQLPAFLQDQIGTYSVPFEEDLYFGKLSWSPGQDHLVEFSFKVRDETGLSLDSGAFTPSRIKRNDNEDTRMDLRYQYNAANWMNDAHLTYEDAYWSPRSNVLEPGYILTTFRDNTDRNIIEAGGGADYQDKGQEGWAFQDDVTWFGWDSHTVKGGVKYKAVEVNSLEQQPFNPQFRYDITDDPTLPWRVNFNASLVLDQDRTITSKNKQFGIYLQDDWEVNDKLTLNYGLRWDYEETPSFLDYVTDPGIAAALRGWSNIQNAGYDIEDYITDGNNRDAFKDAWQPRVGFSYDLFADERHVIFGGAGRAYDRNLFDYLALEQSKHTFPSYERRFNTPSHPCEVGVGNCLEWNPAYLDPTALAQLVADSPNLGAEVNMINNEIKTPYSDQFSLGMRNAFGLWGHEWNSSVTVAHIRSKDGIVFTLGNRWPDGNFHEQPGWTWGGQPWGQPIPGYGTLILADNGIETKLNSLLLSLDKPYTEDSGWGMTLAYTFSDASENRFNSAAFDEHYLFDQENLDGQPMLRAAGISRHRLVATGIVDAPWGITVSSKLVLASPATKDSVNCYDAASFNNCFFDPFTPSGTFGFKQFDLAAEKVWSFGADDDYSIRVRADVLNVFNWRNWTDYDTWHGGPNDPNVNFGTRSGLGTAWPPRLFKVSLGFNW